MKFGRATQVLEKNGKEPNFIDQDWPSKLRFSWKQKLSGNWIWGCCNKCDWKLEDYHKNVVIVKQHTSWSSAIDNLGCYHGDIGRRIFQKLSFIASTQFLPRLYGLCFSICGFYVFYVVEFRNFCWSDDFAPIQIKIRSILCLFFSLRDIGNYILHYY